MASEPKRIMSIGCLGQRSGPRMSALRCSHDATRKAKSLRYASPSAASELAVASSDISATAAGPDLTYASFSKGLASLGKSWSDFDLYESCNVTATQRLLEASYRLPDFQRFVYASTSSVYGRYAAGDETIAHA